MNNNRVLEIISSCGANERRWPDSERDAAVVLVAADSALQAARTEALDLDAMLDEWAGRAVAGATGEAAAAAAAKVLRPASHNWGAVIGGSIAAIVAVLVLINPTSRTVPEIRAGLVASAPMSDEQAYSALFSTTPEEDSLI